MVPQVTVLMAVHNGEPYLRTAIDSILLQTYGAFHFLIVDDASTDGTRSLIRSYDDPRIDLVCLERNLGQTAALNVGVRTAATPWIARMDADDYSAPTRLEKQLQALDADSTLSCIGTWAWMFRDDPRVTEGSIERPLDHEAILQELLTGTPLIHGSLVIRREALLGAGGYDERYRYSADRALYHRLLPRHRAANLSERLLGIRRHEQQGSFSLRAADENIEIVWRALRAKTHAGEEARTLRDSLAYAYLFHARCAAVAGAYPGIMRDVLQALRLAPRQTLRSLTRGCHGAR